MKKGMVLRNNKPPRSICWLPRNRPTPVYILQAFYWRFLKAPPAAAWLEAPAGSSTEIWTS